MKKKPETKILVTLSFIDKKRIILCRNTRGSLREMVRGERVTIREKKPCQRMIAWQRSSSKSLWTS
jgi:hypothetical protein